MNYFVINAPSNLITHVMASSYTPADTKLLKFVVANDRALDIYYAQMEKYPETLLDIGELMAKSAYVYDQVARDRISTDKPVSQRVRAEQTPKPISSQVAFNQREEEVRVWISHHPTADKYKLDEALRTGIVSAEAYLKKYRA